MGISGQTRADELLEEALERLDSYEVISELASKPGFVTQLARPGSPLASATAPSGSYVVIKTIDLQFANRAMWERYAQLTCAHVPRVLDLIELPDALAVVLQYIPGESLETYMARRGALDEGTIITIMSQLCDAASCLANAGIVHRDIKPANVILGFDGVFLIDPGIARIATASQSQDTTILGSWGYAAPEQLGFAETDPRSDVFSLGRVLGFLATGLSPTSPEFQRQLDAPSPNFRPWIDVYRRACALDPAKRPQSAAELEQGILEAARGGGTRPASRMDAGKPEDRYYTFEVMDVDENGVRGKLTQLDGPFGQDLHAGAPTRMATSHPAPQPAHIAPAPIAPPPRSPSAPIPPEDASAMGAGTKIACICVGTLAGLFTLAFLVTGLTGATPSLPRWLNAVYGLAMGILGNLLPGGEIICALARRGAYSLAEHRAKLCWRRILIYWAICFAILLGTGLVNQLFPVP